ncbi:unnamed protein product [Pieris macdunnoughi]|uniref:Tc1-like transposase DDE domain-containing protein n=1 Tax=Pieris macdunnoughi TaxID=345717 RepID=A0A821UD87_9NEOP|nr:unnamed protein product [Pieris macdunnoughi]
MENLKYRIIYEYEFRRGTSAAETTQRVNDVFLKSGQTITADVYCQQLQTMMEKLAAKQPRLVNRSTPLLLHDNARPHTAQQTATKLEELQLECLRHPPYSPDLAPTD